MRTLVVVLWLVYLADCLVRVRPGTVLLHERGTGAFRASDVPDVELLDGRLGIAWLSLWPWRVAFAAAGTTELTVTRARDEFARTRRVLTPLVVAATLLFLLLLGGATVLVLLERTAGALVPWAAGTAAAWAVTVVSFFATHVRLHGTRPSLETSVSMLLSPLSLIRAPSVVCLHSAAALHPVTASAALCDDDEFLRFARRWSFDHEGDRAMVERAADARGLGVRLQDLPALEDTSLTRYCPRCHEGYRDPRTHCGDCGGVPLRTRGEPPGANVPP